MSLTLGLGLGLGRSCGSVVPPVLLTSSPALGDVAAGTPMRQTATGTVTRVVFDPGGANEADGTDVVQVGGVVTCRAPTLPAGYYAVQLVGPGGASNSIPAAYQAYDAASIMSGVARVYDPEVGVGATGGLVDSVADQGTGGKDLLGVTTTRPALVAGRFGDNLRHSITFSKVGYDDTYLHFASPIANIACYSRFWAGKNVIAAFSPSDSGDVFVGTGESRRTSGYDQGGLRVNDADASTMLRAGSQYNDGAPRVHGITHDGVSGVLKFWTNGACVDTQSNTFAAARVNWTGIGLALDAEIGGMVATESVMYQPEIDKIQQLLYGKWCARSFAFHRVNTASPWQARDGARLFAFSDGSVVMVGGWTSDPGHLFNANTNKDTNEQWTSPAGGTSWGVAPTLAGDYTYHATIPGATADGTRPSPRHWYGYAQNDDTVWIMGSDSFGGPPITPDPGAATRGYYDNLTGPGTSDVWMSTNKCATWTLKTSTAAWGPRVFHTSCRDPRDGHLFVFGGQTDARSASTMLDTCFRSADDGANWTPIAAMPVAVSCTDAAYLDGEIFIACGCSYDETAGLIVYRNAVQAYNPQTNTWRVVLADGHGQFTHRSYPSLKVFDGKLVLINGANVDEGNMAQVYTSPTGETWTQQTIAPWRASHADGACAMSDRILVGPGNGDIGQGDAGGIGHVFSIMREGVDLGVVVAATAVPSVVGITPATGTNAGGVRVVVEVDDATAAIGAALDGVGLTGFEVIDYTHVAGYTASHAVGAVDVTVTNAIGESDPLVGGFAYEVPWAPTAASVGCQLWYRPDLGVTESGGLVSAIADQSGTSDSNKNQAASGADRIGYSASDAAYGGKPVFTFSGSQAMAAAGVFSAAAARPLTIVIVGQNGADAAWFSEAVTKNTLFASSGFVYASSNGTGAASFGARHLAEAPSVLMIECDAAALVTSMRSFVGDLTTEKAHNYPSFYPNVPRINFGEGVNGTARWSGKCAEFIVFGGILTSGDKAALVTYLNETRSYGLGVTT